MFLPLAIALSSFLALVPAAFSRPLAAGMLIITTGNS